jgi:hypothetical protein
MIPQFSENRFPKISQPRDTYLVTKCSVLPWDGSLIVMESNLKDAAVGSKWCRETREFGIWEERKFNLGSSSCIAGDFHV